MSLWGCFHSNHPTQPRFNLHCFFYVSSSCSFPYQGTSLEVPLGVSVWRSENNLQFCPAVWDHVSGRPSGFHRKCLYPLQQLSFWLSGLGVCVIMEWMGPVLGSPLGASQCVCHMVCGRVEDSSEVLFFLYLCMGSEVVPIIRLTWL